MIRNDCFISKSSLVDFNKNEFSQIDLINDSKQFFEMVFSADPNTGNSRSDIYYLLSGESPEFQQFIKDKLLTVQPAGSLAETADEALELVNKNLYTTEQYGEIVREYVKSKFSAINSD